jgi:F0F1-type ATP synthase assembly protein I
LSVQEHLDLTTPWGKLMLTVLGMLAEIYILHSEMGFGTLLRSGQGPYQLKKKTAAIRSRSSLRAG